ncbi:MAG TPA: YbhN family protein, partial [Acidimicrobiales bacterium]|nr:YbhN family protein [Acidimicrobiales bacterium]
PVAVGVRGVLLARWPALRARAHRLWETAGRGQRMGTVEGGFERFWARVRTVRLSPAGWLEAFGLALANWTMDAVVLTACILALGVGVPWRGVLVAYALTQVAASLPITPGGLGVVEGSLAALLVAYGMHLDQAVAVTLLYRLVSFWALAPIGWTVWSAIELSQRRGIRTRPHPWAVHLHGNPPPSSDINRQGPGRVIPPRACEGCDEECKDGTRTDDRPAA